MPTRRSNQIVHGQRRISADTALRLARFFGTSERFWINLQAGYDLEAKKDRLGTLDAIVPSVPRAEPASDRGSASRPGRLRPVAEIHWDPSPAIEALAISH